MKIGPYTLHAIETGEFALDGGAMFGVVPKPLWEKKMQPDHRNRIGLRLRALLLQGNGKNILIDNGIGMKGDAKFCDIYRIDHSHFSLEQSLAELHLGFHDITDVILTHLHFDHAGGSTIKNTDGSLSPTFPHATYYVQRANYEWALKPTEKDRASYLKENFEPLVQANQLRFIDGPTELFPHVELFLFNGHTRAQQLPKISDGTTTVFFCADLFPTAAHLSLPWIMAYDNEPLVILREKQELLTKACRERWTLFFEHCPLLTACIPVTTEKGYAVGTVRNFLASDGRYG